jgi:predicted small secreted protein
MNRIITVIALLSLFALTACANTFGGMTKDAKQTGDAIGSSTHRVLKASST